MDECLRELAQRDLALGDDDATRESGAHGVRAADADVFPVDAHTTTFAPASTAFVIAIVMPRSLKEPVGFVPSTLSQTSKIQLGRESVGVEQRRPTLEQGDDRGRLVTGRCSRYASMRPGQGLGSGLTVPPHPGFIAHHAQHRAGRGGTDFTSRRACTVRRRSASPAGA